MLVELVVENYAVVERLRVGFHKGLNLLTGETGSGKSIVVDALGLLYGGRASADMVRTGAERARIAGIFEAPSEPGFRELMERNGMEVEDGELLVEREIQASGKSRAFLGSRPVTAALLKELSTYLGDIHGQHEQQELFRAESQLEMLDSFASAETRLGDVENIFLAWQQCNRELEDIDTGEQEKLRLADLWSFQKKEIDLAGLRRGEDADLENERRVLGNVARLQEQAGGAYDALYESPSAALAQLRQARRKLEELCRIDATMQETVESLRPAEIALEEAAHTLQHYLGGLESDPKRLDQVEARLSEIDKLKRKYGASVEEVLAFGAEVNQKLEAVETAGERRAKLSQERESLAEKYGQAAAGLTRLRQEAALLLEKSVQAELGSLAMEGCLFRVEFSGGDWSARGVDRLRFLISANRGEEPKALDKIASGGELSRVALALKTSTMSRTGEGRRGKVARTLVFDEVDAGIGGGTAEAVGRRLKKLAGASQLLCVTHLPQVAGFADHHYQVEKVEVDGRTMATVRKLEGEERTREIGRMLSGQKMTPEALKQAEQLIKMGSK
ncbi:MAG: DNA repair protein RecN [Acidobacteriia bacterium]|nr:DNA repair protein RecN [Terriglobia bacterium]